MKKLIGSMFTLFVLLNCLSPVQAAGDKDCGDFSSPQELMEFWYSNGYNANNDPHRLDGDNDGLPCEVTSSEYNSYVKSKSTGTTTSPQTGWKQVSGKWYYYTAAGKHTGWLSYDGSWYYMDSYGVMKTGWASIGGKWYYFTSNGMMKTGWLQSGSKWYYLSSNGMVTGWKSVSGKWYFFDTAGVMKTGWLKSGTTWYYLKSSGEMQTGWAKISNKWYYFEESGAMQTGWLNDSDEWYYLDASGVMATGWKQIAQTWYYFYADGVMAHDTVIEGYTLGSNGAMITGIFDVETTKNLEALAADYGIETVYEDDETVSFYVNDEVIGYAAVELVSGLEEYYDFLSEVALVLQAPTNQEEMLELYNLAKTEGYASSEEFLIVADGTYLAFVWGENY